MKSVTLHIEYGQLSVKLSDVSACKSFGNLTPMLTPLHTVHSGDSCVDSTTVHSDKYITVLGSQYHGTHNYSKPCNILSVVVHHSSRYIYR
jgi:hypothetical protein